MKTPRQINTFLENGQNLCPCTPSNKFNLVLIFLPQLRQNSAKIVDSVEENEALENENINKEPESGITKLLQPLATRLRKPVGQPLLVVIFPQFLEVDPLSFHLQQPH